MGGGHWSSNDYSSYRSANLAFSSDTASVKDVFRNQAVQDTHRTLNTIRESCDSDDHPQSRAIIFGLDVTGSMGRYAKDCAREHIPACLEMIYDGKCGFKHPHVLCAAIDDVISSPATALQVTQFEADLRIIEQVRDLFIVGRGGGNYSESYDLLWWFAGHRTKIDCWEKRKTPGFLFSIGDESFPYNPVSSGDMEYVFGGQAGASTPEQSLTSAQQKYHVFHLLIEQGDFCRSPSQREQARHDWTSALGNNVLFVREAKHIGEIICAAMRIAEGQDPASVIEGDELNYAFSNMLSGVES